MFNMFCLLCEFRHRLGEEPYESYADRVVS